jgi:hypothetical protein
MLTRRLDLRFLLVLGSLAQPAVSWAQQYCNGELCPGRIWNPTAYQWDQNVQYVPSRDEYLMATTEWTFNAGGLVGRFIRPDGTLSGGVTTFASGGNGGITNVDMAYNSNADEILLIMRDADPSVIRALYLGSDSMPIRPAIVIAGAGGAPHVAYSPHSDRYLVTFSYPSGGVWRIYYFMLDGDSSNPNPILLSGILDSNALAESLAYNSASQRFLLTFTKDFSPPRRADIFGARITANGVSEGVFAIDTSLNNQQQTRLAYSDSTNTFMVVYEDFVSGQADASGAILNGDGALILKFTIAGSGGWDVPGPIAYNSVTKTFVSTWRSAFSDTVLEHRVREFKPANGATSGPAYLVTAKDIGLLSIDTRDDGGDPQALILWNQFFGEDGVHAGILHLPPAPPAIQPPMPQAFLGVAYDKKIPVVGGRPPLSYQFISGQANLPAGLVPAGDFATSARIVGTATAIGTSGVFRVRVTDVDNRTDEEDLTLTVVLAVPTPISPLGATNQTQPTFTWGASPGATSYNFVIENVTDGGVVLDEPNVAHTFPITSFTPPITLVNGKTYRWKVRAKLGANLSAFSSPTNIEVDTAAPAVSTLMAAPPLTYFQTAATAFASSGDFDPVTYTKAKATDGNFNTLWSTPARTVMQTEFLTVDLGTAKTISRVRLRSPGTGATFPVDFQIQVSNDNNNFTTASSITNFTAAANTEYAFPFTPISARYVRVHSTRVNVYNGKFYTQIAEFMVDQGSPQPNAIAIQWTAPGDDGATGTASSYDLRWSFSPINEGNFSSAIQVPGVGAPQPAGSPEQVVFPGLLQETTYYFALKSTDNANNLSPLSNLAVGVTLGTPPSAITDLSTSNPMATSLTLNWHAPGDEGPIGTATAYVVRYSTSPITLANFDSATLVSSGVPSPAVSGTAQSAIVTGLVHTTAYFFAIKTFDEVGNSSFSNVATGSTLDQTPPATTANLAGSSGAVQPAFVASTAIASSGDASPDYDRHKAVDGNLLTSWSTPGRAAQQQEFITVDTGAVRNLNQVRLRSRDVGVLFPEDYRIDVSVDGANFTTAMTLTGMNVPAATWVTHAFTPVSGRYVRLLVTKSRQYPVNMLYYVQIGEIQVFQAQVVLGSVTLSWTAPGDDGTNGTAATYELRRSTTPINTQGDFDLATPVATTAPQLAGALETMVASGLLDERRYYFRLRTKDEVPNLSGLSNLISADTPGTAPAAVTDLAAASQPGMQVQVAWTATGDDGMTGTAASYELRYSTSPITALNFSSATLFGGAPPPAAPGTPQNVMVGGLLEETTYYFALKVKDELNNISGLSNVPSAMTLDETAPSAVTNLAGVAGGFTYTALPMVVASSSGELLPGYGAALARDGNMATSWSTPARTALQQEQLTLDAGAAKSVGRVRLCSRNVGNLFPVDFEIQVSGDNAAYTTMVTQAGFAATAGTCYPFEFTPAEARYVRLKVTKPAQYPVNMSYYVQLAEMWVDEAQSSVDEVKLTWTAPGDSGNVGTATSYDIRHQVMPFVATNCSGFDYGTAVPVSGEPAPSAAGSAQTVTVDGLSGETKYCFGLRTLDEAGNPSGLSNLPLVMTAAVPPSPVTTLAVSGPTASSVNLTWTSTGDDGMTGTASQYDVRYSTTPINKDNFGSASQASGEPAPAVAGTPQGMAVAGLNGGTLYYFAMKVIDDAPAASLLSNVVSASTLDEVDPAAVTNLAASVAEVEQQVVLSVIASSGDLPPGYTRAMAVDGNLATSWSTPARVTMQEEFLTLDGAAPQNVTKVTLCSRDLTGALFPEDFVIELSLNNVAYTPVVSRVGFVAAAATCYPFTVSPQMARYVRIRVTKSRLYTVNNQFYVQLAEVRVHETVSVPDQVQLTWTAPGDDGATGTAASYDVRYSTSVINAVNFDAATQAAGEPSPHAAGTPESFLVTGLAPDTQYFFAVKTWDESNNVSNISNVPSVTTGSP